AAAAAQKRKAVAGVKDAQKAVAASATAVQGAKAKNGGIRERKTQ
ncbi:hypothetical protein JCM3770_005007, partial [Rhodotorula araucariae]